MRRILLFCLLFYLPLTMFAQQECAFILEEAQDMFDAGLIESIPDKLSQCLEKGFTKEEKLQAYKLIILSFIYDDNIAEADATMLRFLNDFPDYIPVATDPREFTALMESYDTDPVLMIGGSLGANFSFPLVMGSPVGTYNYRVVQGRYVPGGAGFHGAFRVERNISHRLDLQAELAYVLSRYDFYLDYEPEIVTFTGEITDFSIIDYYETVNMLKVPVTVRYRFSERTIQPYGIIGASPSILLTATGEGHRAYNNTGDIRYDPVVVAGENILSMRRMVNIWGHLGAGLTLALGPGDFFLEAIYSVNVLNQERPGSSRFNDKLVFESFYVSDNLLINTLSISAGYMFPIYHPKKKDE